MTARTIIRATLSLFIAVLIAITAAGWIWTAQHQPAGQASASRIVLALAACAGVAGLWAVWRPSDP